MSMWKEFKEFAVKGNAIDLAVGVVIGAAFGSIVNSLVKDVIMPPIGLVTGGLDYSKQFLVLKVPPGGGVFQTPEEAAKLGAVTLNYGSFITAVLNFLIIAFCIFLVVKALNRMKRSPEKQTEPVSKECPFCTMAISLKASRCPHCTSEVPAGSRA